MVAARRAFDGIRIAPHEMANADPHRCGRNRGRRCAQAKERQVDTFARQRDLQLGNRLDVAPPFAPKAAADAQGSLAQGAAVRRLGGLSDRWPGAA